MLLGRCWIIVKMNKHMEKKVNICNVIKCVSWLRNQDVGIHVQCCGQDMLYLRTLVPHFKHQIWNLCHLVYPYWNLHSLIKYNIERGTILFQFVVWTKFTESVETGSEFASTPTNLLQRFGSRNSQHNVIVIRVNFSDPVDYITDFNFLNDYTLINV